MVTNANGKTLVVVCALILMVGAISVGCAKKKDAWVNTASLPGQALAQTQAPTKIIFAGDEPKMQDSFGPRDVDFSFDNLKK